ncbi:MAG: FecR family protein [Alphaproteobacteria bacterium]
MRLWLTATAAALAFTYAAGTGSAQTIGSVQMIAGWAYGTPPGGSRQDHYVNDSVVAAETVETVTDGAMHLAFEDDSELRLGSASVATLDRFVYDPGSGNGEMTANLTRGAFRFISGKLNKSGVRLRTPTALIGIRGTDFLVDVDDTGATVVSVLSGTVTVQNANGGGEASVSAGQAVSVAANSDAAPAPAAAGGIDPALDDAAADAGNSDAGGGGGGGGGGGD